MAGELTQSKAANPGPVLTLFSSGLLSKWGFGDGDVLFDAWWDWCESQGIPYTPIGKHSILCELVETRLVPALDQKVETVRISTNHNPIRATTVNGADAEQYWTGEGDGREPRLTPEYIEIPMGEVARIAAEQPEGETN